MFNSIRIAITKNNALYLSVNVFSTNVLIGDTNFTSPTGDGTAILRGHPSHAKVQPPAGQRKYLHFSVILRPWVLVRPRESNPQPPALQSSALPTELILPRFFKMIGMIPSILILLTNKKSRINVVRHNLWTKFKDLYTAKELQT